MTVAVFDGGPVARLHDLLQGISGEWEMSPEILLLIFVFGPDCVEVLHSTLKSIRVFAFKTTFCFFGLISTEFTRIRLLKQSGC